MGLTFRLGQLPTSLFTDASNNVGIGAAPSGSYKLDITGTGRFTSSLLLDTATNPLFRMNGGTSGSPTIRYDQNGVAKAWLYLTSSGVLQINNSASDGQGIAINNNNVGIGTSSPSSTLTVQAPTSANPNTGGLSFKLSNGTTYFTIGVNNSTGDGAILSGAGGGITFHTNSDMATTNERMKITSAGGVALTGNGNLDINPASGTANISLRSGNTYQGYIEAISGGGILFGTGASATERMRLNSSGRLFVGTTLGLTGRIVVMNDATTGISIFDGSSNGSLLRFYNNSAVEIGSVQTNGSSTTYSTTSDYRLKEDFKEINGLEKVLAVKVYDFKFKNSENRMDGVLAHELAEILPYAVIGQKDAVQENGDIQPQGVDYSLLVPMLTKAIQELNERLNKAGL